MGVLSCADPGGGVKGALPPPPPQNIAPPNSEARAKRALAPPPPPGGGAKRALAPPYKILDPPMAFQSFEGQMTSRCACECLQVQPPPPFRKSCIRPCPPPLLNLWMRPCRATYRPRHHPYVVPVCYEMMQP